jgi:hypothetical protein
MGAISEIERNTSSSMIEKKTPKRIIFMEKQGKSKKKIERKFLKTLKKITSFTIQSIPHKFDYEYPKI